MISVWLRWVVVCSIGGVLFGATPVTYTFTGNGTGNVSGAPLVNAPFTITLVIPDAAAVQPNGGTPITPAITGASIQLGGFGSGTFTDTWQILNVNGLIQFTGNVHGTILDGTNTGLNSYNLQPAIGPLPLSAATTNGLFNNIPVTFSNAAATVTLTTVTNVTFGASLSQPTPISGSPGALTFSAIQGAALGATQNIVVTANSTGAIAFNTQINITSGPAGWLTAPVQTTGVVATIPITASAASLPAGTYTAIVTVTSNGASGSLSLPITFLVNSAQLSTAGGDCTEAITNCTFPVNSLRTAEVISTGRCSNIPRGATNIKQGFQNSTVYPGDGELSTLYPGVDTSLNNWYSPSTMPCPSIGGTIPPIVQPTLPNIDGAATNAEVESLALKIRPPRVSSGPFPTMPGPYNPALAGMASCLNPNASPVQVPSPFCGQVVQSPFHGKDIIYVHGFKLNVIQDVALGNGPGLAGCPKSATSATNYPEWPTCPSAFTDPVNGLFRTRATQYWSDSNNESHIQNYLINRYPNAKNRYITVGWSTAQGMDVAANAVLYQIADAMVNGAGVNLLDAKDPRSTRGFCVDGCVIISHSTGGPVTDVAMSFAADPAYQAIFNTGNISYIPDHVRVHVALAGAFSGSQYATTVMVLAQAIGGVGPEVCALGNLILWPFGASPLINCDFSQLQGTVLLDLVPQIMQTVWYGRISSTPVPVLTIAGASDFQYFPIKFFIQRGFDDGVVTMDSSCARDGIANPVGQWPSGFSALGLNLGDPRLYDIGANFNFSTGGPTFAQQDKAGCNDVADTFITDACGTFNALRYFLEQNYEYAFSALPFNLFPRAAGACAPLKTPWGMIEPTLPYLEAGNPTTFYPNHFTFIQTAEDHFGLLWRSDPGRPDTAAVLDKKVYAPYYSASIYTTGKGLLSDSFKAAQYQATRGLFVEFDLPFGIHLKWWVWKRTYHFLQNWETMAGADYAYAYVN